LLVRRHGAPRALPSFPTRRSSDLGLRAEHLHTRSSASLFDVSHMGQLRVTSPDGEAALHAGLEAALPVDFHNWPDGLQRYTLLRSEEHTSELQSRENLVCRLLLEK